MDTSHDIEMFKEWLATITPKVVKFLLVFAVYYILAALFMVV